MLITGSTRTCRSGALPANTPLNHWLVPVFNGKVRLNKTPLAYWMLAIPLRLGMPLNNVTIRLPSVLAAVTLGLIILALGGRLLSRRVGLIGSGLFFTSLTAMDWGRNACVDMTLCVCVAAAMAVFHAVVIERRSTGWLLLGGVFIGLGCLAKQFTAYLALPSMLLTVLWLCRRRYRNADAADRALPRLAAWMTAGMVLLVTIRAVAVLHWWRRLGLTTGTGVIVSAAVLLVAAPALYARRAGGELRTDIRRLLPLSLAALALSLAMFAPWMLYMARLFPQAGDVFSQQNTGRVLGTENWSGRAGDLFTGYYLWSLLKWTLVWAAVWPLALVAAFRRGTGQRRDPARGADLSGAVDIRLLCDAQLRGGSAGPLHPAGGGSGLPAGRLVD